VNERTDRDPSGYFADTAADYDSWYETPQGAFIDDIETELVFDLVPPVPGEKVLDVGCGTGNFSLKLAQKGCEVTGIDVSPHMLQHALEKVAGTDLPVSFSQMDARHTEFPDDHFDAVYSVTALEFIPDRDQALEELRRVLKPGGRMVIGTIAGDSPWGEAYRAAAEADPGSVFRHADFPTREEIESLREDEVTGSGECLFIPPDADPGRLRREEEHRCRGSHPGGFFAVAWRKPAPSPVSCQISLYPLAGAKMNADDAVREVLKILPEYDPAVQVNPMSSVLSAPPDILTAMLRRVTEHCAERQIPFSLAVTISNTCGRAGRAGRDEPHVCER